MKTWNDELLGNDNALDEIGAILDAVYTAAVRGIKPAKLTRSGAGELAAQLALLVRYHGNVGELFDQKKGQQGFDKAQILRAGVTKHRAALNAVAPKGGAVLDAIVSGEPLPAKLPIDGLLRAAHARPYLQELADRSVEAIDDDIDQKAGAHLDLLCVIAPLIELPSESIRAWQHRMRADGLDDDRSGKHYVRACKNLLVATAGR
jgi:hypothetical protein